MVTFDLETGEIISGSLDHDEDELQPPFRDDGVDYVFEDEILFPRSETPDFLYQLLPDLDELRRATIRFGEGREQIRITEMEEGILGMGFSSRSSGEKRGVGLETALRSQRCRSRSWHRGCEPITGKLLIRDRAS